MPGERRCPWGGVLPSCGWGQTQDDRLSEWRGQRNRPHVRVHTPCPEDTCAGAPLRQRAAGGKTGKGEANLDGLLGSVAGDSRVCKPAKGLNRDLGW